MSESCIKHRSSYRGRCTTHQAVVPGHMLGGLAQTRFAEVLRELTDTAEEHEDWQHGRMRKAKGSSIAKPPFMETRQSATGTSPRDESDDDSFHMAVTLGGAKSSQGAQLPRLRMINREHDITRDRSHVVDVREAARATTTALTRTLTIPLRRSCPHSNRHSAVPAACRSDYVGLHSFALPMRLLHSI